MKLHRVECCHVELRVVEMVLSEWVVQYCVCVERQVRVFAYCRQGSLASHIYPDVLESTSSWAWQKLLEMSLQPECLPVDYLAVA